MPSSSSQHFYDTLADSYDEMTAFDARITASITQFRTLTEGHPVARAVDMGCGTGAAAFALETLGIAVTGIDPSPGMLAVAAHHAQERRSTVRFIDGDFQSPLLSDLAPIDLLLCAGNTLPHIASETELRSVLALWAAALSPTGRIAIQILNYERILRHRQRIVAIRRIGADLLIRFHDFTEPCITFNILRISDGDSGLRHSLNSTPLLPITTAMLTDACRAAGLRSVTLASSFTGAEHHADSTDVVVIAGAGG